MTDEALAERLQQGDTTALSVLIARHQGPLLGFLFNMLGGDRTQAEDLVQESFIRVLYRINTYQPPRPFKSWLYAIATNLARDYFKQADTRKTTVNDEIAVEWMAGPEENLLAQEDANTLGRALLQLPEHQRAAILLRYYHEMSLADVAATLEIPVGTVKSRLSLGLAKLRELMESENG